MRLSKIEFTKKLQNILIWRYNKWKLEEIRWMLWDKSRDLDMAVLYAKWKTLTDISNEYWVSRERARQIILRIKENENKLIAGFWYKRKVFL